MSISIKTEFQPLGEPPLALIDEVQATLSTSQLDTYVFKGHKMRVIVDTDGRSHWVARDVAQALGYRSSSWLTQNLREGEKRFYIVDTPGGSQRMRTLTELGLRRVILNSNKPLAREFQRWVTGEMLPAVSRDGVQPTEPPTPALSEIETAAQKLRIMSRELEKLRNQNRELTLKAEAYDSFLDSQTTYAVGTVAQMLGLGQNTLFSQLRKAGVFISSGSRKNTPVQRYAEYFQVIPHEFQKPNGERVYSYRTQVKPSGIEFIRGQLKLLPSLL